MPSFVSASQAKEFLISAATSTVELFTSPMLCRTSWAGQPIDQAAHVAENIWVTIIASEDQAQTLPLRQAFVQFTPTGTLEVGVMAIIVDQVLPLDGFQHEVRDACRDIFRMILKQRQGKPTAEAWSLNWCEPLMLPQADTSDIDDWLSLVSSLKTEKIKCIAVSREFETEGVDRDKLADDACKTLARLAKLLRTPELQQASEYLPGPGVALVSVLSALQSKTLKQADLDALLVVLKDAFGTKFAFEIATPENVSDFSAEDVWVEFSLPGRSNHDAAQLHAGFLLSGAHDQIKLVLEQGHQYSVKKFGGRSAIANMHQARKRTRAAMSRLTRHGFALEEENLDIAESSLEKVQNAQLTAHRVFASAALKDDRALNSALTEMVSVYSDLCNLQAV